jgi:hypothetical protein
LFIAGRLHLPRTICEPAGLYLPVLGRRRHRGSKMTSAHGDFGAACIAVMVVTWNAFPVLAGRCDVSCGVKIAFSEDGTACQPVWRALHYKASSDKDVANAAHAKHSDGVQLTPRPALRCR